VSAAKIPTQDGLTPSPLLPEGYQVPVSRFTHPSMRMRQLLESEPFLFGPGVYDPMCAQLVMYHGFKAVYFSGYSFAIGHLGTTDMDLYSNVEIADAARRTVSALRKFQLTMAVGDPEKGIAPRHLDIPPVIVDMDGGYGNIFNVQRTTELYVNGWVAAAHIEDQVLPKRCGHIGGKALIPVNEMLGKLRLARNVAASIRGEPTRPFRYRTLGQLATLGHYNGIGTVGPIRLWGFPAWAAWRTYYLWRLPRLEKRLRVATDWTVDLIFGRDISQIQTYASTQPGNTSFAYTPVPAGTQTASTGTHPSDGRTQHSPGSETAAGLSLIHI